jgi:hypothetical protein
MPTVLNTTGQAFCTLLYADTQAAIEKVTCEFRWKPLGLSSTKLLILFDDWNSTSHYRWSNHHLISKVCVCVWGGGWFRKTVKKCSLVIVNKGFGEHTASIFTSTMKLQAVCSSETSAIMHQTKQFYNPKTTNFCSETPKPHVKCIAHCTF